MSAKSDDEHRATKRADLLKAARAFAKAKPGSDAAEAAEGKLLGAAINYAQTDPLSSTFRGKR